MKKPLAHTVPAPGDTRLPDQAPSAGSVSQQRAQGIMAQAMALIAAATDQYQRTIAMTHDLCRQMLKRNQLSAPSHPLWAFRPHTRTSRDCWLFIGSVRRLRQAHALHLARQQNLLYAASGLHKQAAGKHEAAAQHHREAAAMHEAAMPQAAKEASDRAQTSSEQAQLVSKAAQPKRQEIDEGAQP